MKYLFIILLLPACTFGPAVSEEERKSFACESGKAACILTKETCRMKDQKRDCTTTIDVTCSDRGDEKSSVIWKSETTTVGNNTVTMNCQVSNITR